MGKFEVKYCKVFGMAEAIYGMRMPLESFDRSDSTLLFEDIKGGIGSLSANIGHVTSLDHHSLVIGDNDRKLAKNLIKSGKDHRKFLRQIHVTMIIKGSTGWWSEMDTYKVGTVRNSTSTMHKLGKRLLTNDDFIWYSDYISDAKTFDDGADLSNLGIISRINESIEYSHNLLGVKEILPQSFAYTSLWTANYEVLRNIYHSRKNHRMPEWKIFCEYLENNMPESWMITE